MNCSTITSATSACGDTPGGQRATELLGRDKTEPSDDWTVLANSARGGGGVRYNVDEFHDTDDGGREPRQWPPTVVVVVTCVRD